MLLCFVDESVKDDFYGFAAIIADEHATLALTARLNEIIVAAHRTFDVDLKAELHGYPLFHGRADWADVGPRARVRIFEQTIGAIVDADVTILMRSIDPARLAQRQARANYPVDFPPEQVAFQHILQRANLVAEREDTYALIIADERGDRDRHRERFVTYQTIGTPGVYMQTKLSRLLDTVHFAPSHHSRMIQAADMVAFTFRRFGTVTESDPRAHATMKALWAALTSSGKTYDIGGWP